MRDQLLLIQDHNCKVCRALQAELTREQQDLANLRADYHRTSRRAYESDQAAKAADQRSRELEMENAKLRESLATLKLLLHEARTTRPCDPPIYPLTSIFRSHCYERCAPNPHFISQP